MTERKVNVKENQGKRLPESNIYVSCCKLTILRNKLYLHYNIITLANFLF